MQIFLVVLKYYQYTFEDLVYLAKPLAWSQKWQKRIFLPSHFPYVLQIDINNALFPQPPKNVGCISTRTMKLQVTSVLLIFPFAEQFHAIAVCLWDLLILVGWSACNSFCFSSLGDPLHAVSVCCISALADPVSLSVLVALSSAVCYCSKLWNDQRGGWGVTNCFNICSGRDGVAHVRCVVGHMLWEV